MHPVNYGRCGLLSQHYGWFHAPHNCRLRQVQQNTKDVTDECHRLKRAFLRLRMTLDVLIYVATEK